MYFTAAVILACALTFTFTVLARQIFISRTRKKQPKNCSGCRHFNLAAGQQAMQAHLPFILASQHVPPSRMGRPRPELMPFDKALELFEQTIVQKAAGFHAVLVFPLDDISVDAEASTEDEALAAAKVVLRELLEDRRASLVPHSRDALGTMSAKWEDFGACGKHEQVIWSGDSCEDWSRN